MMIRLLSYLLLAGHFISCPLSSRVSSKPCERVTLSYDNHHDSSRVIFEGRVVFDTTANQVRGKVIDGSLLTPLSNAVVILRQDNRTFTDTTDMEGVFSIFENDFIGVWRMTTTHNDYNCLMIDSIMVGGGQNLIIKLKKQL